MTLVLVGKRSCFGGSETFQKIEGSLGAPASILRFGDPKLNRKPHPKPHPLVNGTVPFLFLYMDASKNRGKTPQNGWFISLFHGKPL